MISYLLIGIGALLMWIGWGSGIVSMVYATVTRSVEREDAVKQYGELFFIGGECGSAVFLFGVFSWVIQYYNLL